MGVTLQRHLGPARTLDRKQWTELGTASGQPALACPECGQIDEFRESDVDRKSGRFRYIWMCPSDGCAFRDFLTLEAWGEEVCS